MLWMNYFGLQSLIYKNTNFICLKYELQKLKKFESNSYSFTGTVHQQWKMDRTVSSLGHREYCTVRNSLYA